MAMGQIFAPIIAITLVLLSVFVPVAFIPGISGELFRQFAVTVAVSMFLSAINALTLSPALCAHPAAAASRSAARHHRLGDARRSTGCATPTAPWSRGWCASRSSAWSWSRSPTVGVVGVGKDHADRLPAGRRSGRVLRHRAVARRRLGRAHDRGRSAGRGDAEAGAGGRGLLPPIIGLNFIDNYSQPNAAFMVVSLKPFDERTGAVAIGAGDDRAAGDKFRQIRGGARRADRAAADHRSRHRRRLQLCAAGRWRRRSQGAGAGAARTAGGGQPGSASCSRVFSTFSADNPSIYLDIDRDKAQILGVDVSRRLPGAAGLARRILRQRHESVRAHLAGAGAGRGRRTGHRSTTSTGSMCAVPTAR